MKLFFFDLETTGLDHKTNGIHQLSGSIDVNGVECLKFNIKMAPPSDLIVEDAALKIAGVTKDDIMKYPSYEEAYKTLIRMLYKFVDKYNNGDKFFLVGYNNAAFDNQFLRSFFAKNNDKYFGSWFWSNSFDVMVLASYLLKDRRSTMRDFKLKTVAAALGIEVDESKLHDAEYDIDLTKKMFYKFHNECQNLK